MSPRFCHPESLPWAVFTTENMRRLTLSTRMHPEHDSNLEEEEFTLIPQPLPASQEIKGQLSPSEKNTLLESLDTIDEVDQFLDSFQQDIKELLVQETTSSSEGLETTAEEGTRYPTTNPNEDRRQSCLSGPEILLPDICVPKPLALRQFGTKQADEDGPSIAPRPNTNTAKSLGPAASGPRSLAISKRPVSHRLMSNRLSSLALQPRTGIDIGRSRASTFIDYAIHQELTQYKISSDHVSPKTPPISPKTPRPKIFFFPELE